MSFRLTATLTVALSAFAVAPALAQQSPSPDPSPSASAPPEIGRVVTSDRHEEPITATTRPTFIVDRAQIDARGDRTIADALVGVPGVDVFRYGGFGAAANVFIHGTNSSAQVLVLLDGTPLAPGSSGQIDLGSFSTVGVRRIEIVEGGGSTLYGTSAVGGVINIITGIPRGTYLEASGGSYGDRDLRVSAGAAGLGVAFERHIATNNYAYPASATFPAGVRENADAEQSAARLTYDRDLGKNLTARVRVGSSAIHTGVPGDLEFLTTPEARQNTSQNDTRVEIARNGAQSATVLTLAASAQSLTYADPQNQPVESDTYDGRAQLSLRNIVSGSRGTLTTGIDLSRESALLTGVASYDANGNASYVATSAAQAQSAAYAQYQYGTPNGARVVVGLRGEHDAPIGGVLSPSIGFALPLAPGTRLAFNASNAFRVPTIIDRYYPGFANPNLKPERSSDGDLTLETDRILGGAALTWFGREATNLIQTDPNNGFIPENIAKASIRGLQATIKTRPYHGFVTTLALTNTYRAVNLTPGMNATRLNFDPVFTTSLTLDHPLAGNRVGFGATANLYGPHQEASRVNPGWTTVDAYVRARVYQDAVLSVRVRNLGDERYVSFFGYPALGRTFALELATR